MHMSKMIQLRNVPDSLHRKVKARAAQAGMSLSDYLIEEIRKSAEVPTIEEFRARLARLPRVSLRESPEDAIRAERDNR
jgi:antitoxin FitA